MKKIGFVDLYISEWHANNYPVWFSQINEATGSEYKVAYAWAEQDVSPLDGVTTAEWCEKFGAEKCETLAELCEKSDCIVILAPSDPEKHLEYAKVALRYGKRTYIDKTFAPNLGEAEEIFALANKYKAPIFSSSALRYATELDVYDGCRQIDVTGSGSSADEYIVHQVEMVVKKLGIGARAVMAEPIGDRTFFRIRYDDGRCATMIYASSALPFTVYMSGGESRAVWKAMKSEFFKLLMADILRFFDDGVPSFDPNQTLEVMKIREGALKAQDTPCEWIKL